MEWLLLILACCCILDTMTLNENKLVYPTWASTSWWTRTSNNTLRTYMKRIERQVFLCLLRLAWGSAKRSGLEDRRCAQNTETQNRTQETQRHRARCKGQSTWGSFISRALRGGVQWSPVQGTGRCCTNEIWKRTLGASQVWRYLNLLTSCWHNTF